MKIDFSKKALIAYITAGLPDMVFTKRAVLKLQEAGVSAVEIGIPYSDPVVEGKTIANASMLSLERGTNLDMIFDAVAEISPDLKIPVYFMSYYSPIFTYGEDKTFAKCKESGVSGLIIPDLCYEEGLSTFTKIKDYGLDPIMLAFPNTDNKRLKEIGDVGGSFVYYVNLFGTTGERNEIPVDSINRLREAKQVINTPLCAGFGVSSRAMFDTLSGVADGVIVGSAIVRRILDNLDNPDKALDEISDFIKELRG
jgi:tryptophan synthase alpha chain